MEVSDDVHVRVLSVASEGLTVAVRIVVSPSVISRLDLSSTTSATSITLATTVTSQLAEIPLAELTVMSAEPEATAVTSPFSETVTMEVSDDVHVRVLSVASEGLTVAVSIAISPSVISRLDLSRSISVTSITLASTLMKQVAVKPLEEDAKISTLPGARAETVASAPSVLTVAILSSEDDQLIVLSVASTGSIVAVSTTVLPSIILRFS